MKIFISWSGKRSLGVAVALRDWLPYLFSSIIPFVSSEDIRKGKRWPLEVSKELESSNFGIVCLTPDNLEAPWLLFESGALSKSVAESAVYTLLTGGLKPSDIEAPLSHFQHTNFEKEDFFKLVKSINDANKDGKHDESRLRKVFDKFWPDIETDITKVVSSTDKPEKKRTLEEMMQEVLETTNHIARQIPARMSLKSDYPLDVPIENETWEALVAEISKLVPDCGQWLSQSLSAHITHQGFLSIVLPESVRSEQTTQFKMAIIHNAAQSVFIKLGMGPIRGVTFRYVPI